MSNITNYILKKTIFLTFLIIGLNSFSQENAQLKKLLSERFPVKESFVADGIWIYYPKDNEPRKLKKPIIEKNLTGFELYCVNIVNFLDQHILDSECLILFNKTQNKIIFGPPIWYSGLEKEFYKSFIGFKFKDKTEIEAFVKEFQSIILNDANETIDNTKIDNTSATFDMFRVVENGAYRKIKLVFEKMVLIKIEDLNPNTLEVDDVIE
ncbi:hypothetical protein [Flavobacterium mekongense]|uniref:hypothetical protein n=1 Tax=Flavobacterium mekongense TaxID=3379707 RepID=UPI00399BC420